MLISARDSAHAFSVKYIPRMCVAVIDRRNGCNLSASRENCTAWLHEVLLAMLMEQHTVVFLYQLAQARPNNVLLFLVYIMGVVYTVACGVLVYKLSLQKQVGYWGEPERAPHYWDCIAEVC